jgi:hypothetical protein
MKNLAHFIDKLSKEWTTKTLDDLRSEAVLEDTGLAFDAVREANGKRLFMVMCVTGEKNIAYVSERLNLIEDGLVEDWSTLTLAEVLMRTSRAGGLCFELFQGDSGTILAVTLIAADPDSVRTLSGLFDMPE